MANNIKKNVYSNSLPWTPKLDGLSSFIQETLKRLLIGVVRVNLFTLGIGVLGLTYYISILETNLKSKKFTDLIFQNVPGVYTTSLTISWQTFQKTPFLPSLPISQTNETSLIKLESSLSTHILENQFLNAAIDSISHWSQYLQLKFNSKWASYKKQYFLGVKKPPKKQKALKIKLNFIFSARDNLTSSDYECFLSREGKTKVKLNRFQKTFYQLDEFPLNLQQIQSSDTLNKLSLQVPTSTETNSQLAVNQDKRFLKNEITFSTEDSERKLTAIYNRESVVDPSSTTLLNLISLDKTYLKWRALRNQINELFYEKNYFSSTGQFNFISNQLSLDPLLKNSIILDVPLNQLLFILDKIDSTSQSSLAFTNKSPFFIGREMSGFTYPDTTTEHIESLYQKLKYYTKIPQFHFFGKIPDESYINVQLGPHFSYPVNHSSISRVPEKLKFKYTPIELESFDEDLYYSGPGIVTNSNELDEVTYNFSSAQITLQEKLNSFDPRKINFSRTFVREPSNSNILDSSDFEGLEVMDLSMFTQVKSKKHCQKFLNSNRDLITSEREPTLTMNRLDFKSEYIVPQLPNSKTWFDEPPESLLFEKRLSQLFPVKQTSFISNANSYTLFDILDYQNLLESLRNRFLLKVSKTPESELFHAVPKQSSLPPDLNQRTSETLGFVDQTQLLDELDPPSFPSFVVVLEKLCESDTSQVCEPIHIKSWLVITQFLLTLGVFHFFKKIATEYGRELFTYLIDLITAFGFLDESVKEEFTGDTSKSGYRIITNSQKSFKDIAGIEHIFSPLSEIIWFLKNLGRSFSVSNALSRGILLVGPPGTGKTLLVQTIAGESGVPVVAQSASALNSTDSSGAQKLQRLFARAKQLSPCVVFFDEIDSIGERRQHIIGDHGQTSKLIKIISPNNRFGHMTRSPAVPFNSHLNTYSSKSTGTISTGQPSSEASSEKLGLLMQLLIELDGLQSARRIIIIGATNRPNVLDPALIRPGRLDQVFQLGLPGKEKRIEICQLSSKILDFDTNIPWNYIGNKTTGLSGADLAAIINQSAIQAILQKTQHTIDTLELAIGKIIGDSTVTKRENAYNQIRTKTSKFRLARSGYYYSGLAIGRLLVPELNTSLLCSLFPINQNERYLRMLNNLLQSKLPQTQRRKLEAELVTIYAGKILEILSLGRTTSDLNIPFAQSDLGKNELNKGTNLIYLLVNRWFLYSHNQIHGQSFSFFENRNKGEIVEPNIYVFLNELLDSTNKNPIQAEKSKYKNFQRWTTKSWWQSQISQENASFNTIYADWYRIYVANPDETEINDEWILPDRYFHANQTYLLTRTINFNNLYKIRRDLTYKFVLETAILNATSILSKTNEFNDFFVMNLIQRDQLRQHEMDQLYTRFYT